MNKEQERNKYLVKNTAIFALGNLATKFISFFLVPLYTSILTTSEYGIVDLINTISMIAVPVLILNISEAIMRFSLDKGADYNKIMSIGLLMTMLSVPIGALFVPVVGLFEDLKPYAWYVYLFTITLGMSQVFLSYLRGKEKLLQLSIGNIIQTLSIACFNILFLCHFHMRIEGYFLAYIIANIITCVYAFIVGDVKKVVPRFEIDKRLASEMIKYSIVLVPNTFMWWIINSSDRVMVAAMIGTAANGIYAISYKVPSMIQIFSNIFNQAWTYSAIREDESQDREAYSNRVYNGVTAVAMISGVGVLAIIKPFLKYYVSSDYYIAWQYTPFLVVGYVFVTMGAFLATTYTVNKDSKGFLFSGCSGAIANIVLNFLLIPYMGITGAAVATGLSYIVVFFYRAVDTKKYMQINAFGRRQILATVVLCVAVGTLFVESFIGQIFLLIETVAELLIFADVWIPLVKNITINVYHGRKK